MRSVAKSIRKLFSLSKDMDIRYLTLLNDNQTVNGSMSPGLYLPKTLRPLAMSDITSLENTYNNGHPFPTSLRELLIIAGGYCYVLSRGTYASVDILQQKGRAALADDNQSITRPFFIIDYYNGPEFFVFLYLDESQDDPQL